MVQYIIFRNKLILVLIPSSKIQMVCVFVSLVFRFMGGMGGWVGGYMVSQKNMREGGSKTVGLGGISPEDCYMLPSVSLTFLIILSIIYYTV